jgi:hypothetical protein
VGLVLPAEEGEEDIVRRYSVIHRAVSIMIELFPPVMSEDGLFDPE